MHRFEEFKKISLQICIEILLEIFENMLASGNASKSHAYNRFKIH
jgi:hypothetical protein